MSGRGERDGKWSGCRRELVRAMTAEQKLRLSQALRDSAWEFKAAWIRSNQPELGESAVQDAVRRLFRHVGA